MADRATRLAALAGREFLPAARSHANLMRQIDNRRRLATRPVWTVRPRTRVRIERWGAVTCIAIALAAALLL